MEFCPVRPVFGYCEIFWSLRQAIRKRSSSGWPTVRATVEGYEFLAARQNGWLAIFYSYEFAGEIYPGELRQWLMLRYPGYDESVSDTIRRFPRGARIDVSVNPSHPARSVA